MRSFSSGERRLRRRSAHIKILCSDEAGLAGGERKSYRRPPVGGASPEQGTRFRRSTPVSGAYHLSSGERRLRRRSAHIKILCSDEAGLAGGESESYRHPPVGGASPEQGPPIPCRSTLVTGRRSIATTPAGTQPISSNTQASYGCIQIRFSTVAWSAFVDNIRQFLLATRVGRSIWQGLRLMFVSTSTCFVSDLRR